MSGQAAGDELESRLVWIFGSPRTGSTWFLELLAHPLVLEARDPLGFTYPGDSPEPIDLLPLNESLLPHHLMPPVPEDALARGPWMRAPSDIFGGLGAYFFSSHYEDVWRPAVRAMGLARFRAHLERASTSCSICDRALIAIKEPNGSHAAPLVMSLFDRARLIFLYRDGRDVIDSLVAMSGPGGLLAGWRGVAVETREQRLALIREESLNWVARMTATELAFEQRPPQLRWRLRYEDLVAEPERCLAGVEDWLGLERSSDQIAAAVTAHALGAQGQSPTGAAGTSRTGRPGLWQRNLSADESALAHEIMGEKLSQLGYDGLPAR